MEIVKYYPNGNVYVLMPGGTRRAMTRAAFDRLSGHVTPVKSKGKRRKKIFSKEESTEDTEKKESSE